MNEDKYKWREHMSVEDEILMYKNGMGMSVGNQDEFLYYFCKLIMAEMKKVRRDHCE